VNSASGGGDGTACCEDYTVGLGSQGLIGIDLIENFNAAGRLSVCLRPQAQVDVSIFASLFRFFFLFVISRNAILPLSHFKGRFRDLPSTTFIV
jgi:hypothetical protein